MPTKVDASRFAMVPRTDVPRSAFDIRFNHKTTIGAEFLWPIFVDEVLPGDSLRLRMNALCRLATPIVPLMDNLYLESFFFFVPNRLVWDNWERFMGEQTGPTDTTAFLVPYQTLDDGAALLGSVHNIMGLQPAAVGETYNVNALPFRAMHLIWNDWFRDQDLQERLTVPTGDGPDTYTDFETPPRRGKRHDYFTSCRPWPQKPSQSSLSTTYNANTFFPGGDMGTVSLGGSPGWSAGAPVSGLGITALSPTTGPANLYETGSRTVSYPKYYTDAAHDIRLRAHPGSDYPDVRVLISDIRTANQVQLFMERNARGGSRYTELMRAHFGVQSPDARLQRPEYLGGGRTMVNINPVAQTSETTANGVLGEQAGIGTAVVREHGFSQSFVEHGFIIGFVNIRGDLSYQKGVNRMWFRRTVFDHYFPTWAYLAEQPVLKREIYCNGAAADEEIFGYQERWAEYRYKPNMITGAFQSWQGAPLDIWHLAQNFGATRPELNASFIEDKTPVSRVLQVGAFLNEQALLDTEFSLRWVRPLPMFSVPGLGPRL